MELIRALYLLTFLLMGTDLDADSQGNGEITGFVTTKAGTPIREAAAAIASGTAPYPDIAALTDDRGEYYLSDIPPGVFEVAVHCAGYALQKQTVIVRANEVSVLNFVLIPE